MAILLCCGRVNFVRIFVDSGGDGGGPADYFNWKRARTEEKGGKRAQPVDQCDSSIRGIRCLVFWHSPVSSQPPEEAGKNLKTSTIFQNFQKLDEWLSLMAAWGRGDGTSLTSSKRPNCFLCSLAGEQVCAGIFLRSPVTIVSARHSKRLRKPIRRSTKATEIENCPAPSSRCSIGNVKAIAGHSIQFRIQNRSFNSLGLPLWPVMHLIKLFRIQMTRHVFWREVRPRFRE